MEKVILEAEKACSRHSHKVDTVYLIGCGEFVKIGYTRGHVETRLNDMAVGCPMQLTLLGQIPGSLKLERTLHKLFHLYRHRGEWFRNEGSLAEFVQLVGKRNSWPRPSARKRSLTRLWTATHSLLEELA